MKKLLLCSFILILVTFSSYSKCLLVTSKKMARNSSNTPYWVINLKDNSNNKYQITVYDFWEQRDYVVGNKYCGE